MLESCFHHLSWDTSALLKWDINSIEVLPTAFYLLLENLLGKTNLAKYFLSNFIKVQVSDISNELP